MIEYTVATVFENLPTLAQQYVMRLLHKPPGFKISEDDISRWVQESPDKQLAHKEPLSILKRCAFLLGC